MAIRNSLKLGCAMGAEEEVSYLRGLVAALEADNTRLRAQLVAAGGGGVVSSAAAVAAAG